MSVSAADRHASVLAPAEEYLEVGFNYRMTDLQAAVGLVQLGRLDEVVARRREIAAAYRKALAEIAGLRCAGPAVRHQQLPVVLGRGRAGLPARPRGAAGAAGRRRSRPAAASWPRTASPPTPAWHRTGRPARHRAAHRQHPDPAGVPPDDRGRAGPGHRCDPEGCGDPMTELLLVAASGLAREVLACVREHGQCDVVGVLDDDVHGRGSPGRRPRRGPASRRPPLPGGIVCSSASARGRAASGSSRGSPSWASRAPVRDGGRPVASGAVRLRHRSREHPAAARSR